MAGNRKKDKTPTKKGKRGNKVDESIATSDNDLDYESKQTRSNECRERKTKKSKSKSKESRDKATKLRQEKELELNFTNSESVEAHMSDMDMRVSESEVRNAFPLEGEAKSAERNKSEEDNEDTEVSEDDDMESVNAEDSDSQIQNKNDNATAGNYRKRNATVTSGREDGEVSDGESGVIQFKLRREESLQVREETRMDDDESDDEEAKRFFSKMAKFMDKRDKRLLKDIEDRERKLIMEREKLGKEREKQEKREKEQKLIKENKDKEKDRPKGQSISSNSEITIYKPAIEVEIQEKGWEKGDQNGNKRGSSSSEELNNISDDMVNVSPDNNIENYIVEARRKASSKYVEDGQQPQTSRAFQEPTPEEEADKIIRQAERSKARILEVPGMERANLVTNNSKEINEAEWELIRNKEMLHSVLVDEGYSAVACHVDDATRRRIITCEYVNFAKLIPTDRMDEDEDQCMRMVNKGGVPAWAPAKDREVISSFSKWEQAFRVYSNIYTEVFPRKAAELIQYNHVINTAAQSFVWDNVYLYDKMFRRHLSKFPSRSWAVILQQAWTMCLKDRYGNGNDRFKGNGDRNKQRRDVCWKFNKGKCTFGLGCKFEHKCALCLKFGHGSHNCRRTKSDRDRDLERNYREPHTDRESGERYYYPPTRYERNDRYHYTKKDRTPTKKDLPPKEHK